jgi:hypothetical protein
MATNIGLLLNIPSVKIESLSLRTTNQIFDVIKYIRRCSIM